MTKSEPRRRRGRGALLFFAALAGSVLGAAVQLQQPVLWHALLYAGLLSGALLGLCLLWRLGGRARWPCILMALACGMAAGAGQSGWRAAWHARNMLPPALEGRDLLVTGVVAQMPQRGDGGVRFRFDVESVRGLADGERFPQRLALGWYAQQRGPWLPAGATRAAEPFTPLHAGERWRLPVRLKAPHGDLNPHGFDRELSLWEQGVQAAGYVRGGADRPEHLAQTWGHPIERAREAVRDAIFERVAERRAAGVVAALVTGDQGAIERADWEVFRTTGVAHLMSISGLHITMFGWLAALAAGAAWRRSTWLMLRWPAPQAALLCGALLATLYALFSGWGLPAQRTVWMLWMVAMLRLSGRRWPWPLVWLMACALVVGLDPWALMQAGFWLSFVAVGVLFASDAGAPQQARPLDRLRRALREQWVVTLALAPLGLLLFQQVSLVGLFANAAAIPWVTLVVTPLAMLGVLWPWLWEAAAWTVQALAWGLQQAAALPLAALSLPAPPLWAGIAGVAGALPMVMRLPWTLRLAGLPLLLPVLLWQPPRPAAGEFELLAADVGQGSAVLVRTATHSLLYDTGPRYGVDSDAGQRVLVPLLRALGERLNRVVLSHRDDDHAGGAAAVLAMQPQADLLSSIEATHPLQALHRIDRCQAGLHWAWDGVQFELLHPRAEDYARAANPNAISCVLRIANGRAAALLAGDVPRDQEAMMAREQADALKADVLLVPHHGSKTSSSAPWLDAVRPRVALVQAGYRNRFGHPADAVLQRYRERGIAVVVTTACGAARWQSTAPGDWQCERQANRRYWHHHPAPP